MSGASVILELLSQHAELIFTVSGIAPEVAKARSYRSLTTRADVTRLGFSDAQARVPALLIPIWDATGQIRTYQVRPDEPRTLNGRVVKYETPKGSRMVLDVPPLARPYLGNPARPLLITEGPRKADSAVSRGLCAVSLLGVWNWRGTNGDGGKVALPDWEAVALNDRQVYLGFDSDVMTKPEVAAALERLKLFLESRGARVLVIHLPHGEAGAKMGLDDFLAAGHDTDALLALAAPPLPATPRTDSDDGPYLTEKGRLCRRRQTQHGVIIDPLCNFSATVSEEVVLDDGAETLRAFIVEGCLETGERLPAVRVPASRFAGMGWVTETWGLRAVIRAGQANRDYLREAIQRLSPATIEHRVYTHTGWRMAEGGRWIYLTASGAVGRDGYEVDLGPELGRYYLPRNPETLGAMRASLQLLRIAPLRVTAPLWAGVFRAPLATAFPVDISLWIEGQTGSLKSTLAALFLSHWGDFDRIHLPGAWSSTANQLERRAFVLKDALFAVDDYAPSAVDARDMEAKAARLLRAQGNLAGRGRLRADLTDRPAFPPRGMILSTGEQHPAGQSLLARMLLIEMERADVNLAALTEAQRTALALPHALAGYVEWLAPQMSGLSSLLRETFTGARARATAEGEHLRVPEALAHLWLGLHSGLTYAEEIGACSGAEAEDLRMESWEALQGLGRAQGRVVEEERPTRRFLAALLTLLTQRRALLLSKHEGEAGNAKDGSTLIGWQDDDFLLLIPEAALHAVGRFCRDGGEPFPVRADRLKRDLRKENLTESDPDRYTATVRVAGRTRRVLKLRRRAVEALLGQDLPTPSPVVTTITTITGFGE